MKELTLYVISHTHWDREWYEDFQAYRYRLVRMMDDLLHTLDTNPAFQVFHLDGQTIVLNDYLEIRPENEARLRAYLSSGRIVIGPWYVMPDEFLISGESLIKNLQVGHKIAGDYQVKPLKNGYVTDIFGHNSQFPQILKGFGIPSATLYRGIGDYPKDAFRWRSPDGSTVDVAKLDRERSYSNFYFAVRWPFEKTGFCPEEAVRRMNELLEHSKKLATSDCIVMMDGCDHLDAECDLPMILNLFNEKIEGVHFVHANLEDYFTKLQEEKVPLETIDGALYHVAYEGVNNQVLKNVLSSTIPLKQKNDACERLLRNYAEPLDAFSQILPQKAPLVKNEYYAAPRKGFFDTAWDFLLQNQPHDSICGCSKSGVHEDNEYRFAQTERIGNLMTEDALSEIIREIVPSNDAKNGNVLLYNPSVCAYDGCFEADLILPAGHSGNLRFYDAEGKEVRVQTIAHHGFIKPKHRLRQLIEAESYEEIRAIVEGKIPPVGYAVLSYEILFSRGIENQSYAMVDVKHPKRLTGSLMTAYDKIDNGIYEIVITSSGQLDVTDKKTGRVYAGLHVFEDCGDCGDGWNYRKPQYDAACFSNSGMTHYSVISDGPLGCVVRIVKELPVPASLGARESVTATANAPVLRIATDVTILQNNPIIRFKTEMENTLGEHRLRVLFPTSIQTDSFYTKTPFDLYRWNIQAEEYAEHLETETFVHPSQGITYLCNEKEAFSLYSRGLYEVEVTDNASHTVALTLMRSPANETWNPIGYTALKRLLTFEYAMSFADTTPSMAFRSGETWRNPLKTKFFPQSQGTNLPRATSFLTLDTETVQLSSVTREEEKVVVRLFDVSGIASTAKVTFLSNIKKATLVDFLGNEIESVSTSGCTAEVPVAPHKIVSLQIQF